MAMDINTTRTLAKDATRIVMLIVLVAVLWFALVWTGIISCNMIPMGCDIYWGVMRFNEGGQPRILIAYNSISDHGMGDAYLLQNTLADPQRVRVQSYVREIESISLDNLKDYDLVIVTQAQRISSKKLEMFVEYANSGGILVWTGDAGTKLATDDEYLYEDERNSCETGNPVDDANKGKKLNVWARKLGDKCISLDELIGVEYVGMYCDFRTCSEEDMPRVGIFSVQDRENRLVHALIPDLTAYGNFAYVEEAQEAINIKHILDFDFKADVFSNDGDKMGRFFPMILQSGFGGKVVYYAIPPEMFVSELMPIDEETGERIQYPSFIDNMYYALLH